MSGPGPYGRAYSRPVGPHRCHDGHAGVDLPLVLRAHSLKSLERNILSFAGIRSNRHTLIGMIEGMSDAKRGVAGNVAGVRSEGPIGVAEDASA